MIRVKFALTLYRILSNENRSVDQNNSYEMYSFVK